MISVARLKNSVEGFTSPTSDEQQTGSRDSTGVFSISKSSKRLQKLVAKPTECPFARSLSMMRMTSPSTGCIVSQSRSKAFCLIPSAVQRSVKEVTPRSNEGCSFTYVT